jgi:hypothetical protein
MYSITTLSFFDMKKMILLAALIASVTAMPIPQLHAQNRERHGEVGLSFGALTSDRISFNCFYKKQVSDRKYRRFMGGFGDLRTTSRGENASVSTTINFSYGTEKRIDLDDQLQFYTGPQLLTALNYAADNSAYLFNIAPGVGYLLGIQHNFNEKWGLHLEVVPSARIFVSRFSDGSYAVSSDINVTNAASLGLVRAF